MERRLEAATVYISSILYLFYFYPVKVRIFAKSVTTMYMLIRRLFFRPNEEPVKATAPSQVSSVCKTYIEPSAIALYDYEPTAIDDLSFNVRDVSHCF